MNKITLGNTGIEVTELGFGAMYLPRVSARDADIILKKALALGINYFDTASAYQDSEEKLGTVFSAIQAFPVIASRSISYKAGVTAFKKDFEQSLRRLRREYIDFYGFHSVNQPAELETVLGKPLDFLMAQKQQGTLKHIAITGHNPKTLLEAVNTGFFEMVMFPFNIIEQEPLDGLLRQALHRGVATSIMKPLAGGVIERKDLALRFFFSHPSGVVTPGISSLAELETNYAIFDERRPLSEGELDTLKKNVAVLGRDFCRRCSYCMPCPQGIMIPFVHMVHMKCYDKPMDDDVRYTLNLGKQLIPALEKCDACESCINKCPYNINTPKRVKELLLLLLENAK